jgi:hypothetical protein
MDYNSIRTVILFAVLPGGLLVGRNGKATQLETFGAQGYLGGWITTHLQGRTIDCLMRDGLYLIIRCTDGHEARIGWQDTHGNQLKGDPFLENLDVKIAVPGAGFAGKAGT